MDNSYAAFDQTVLRITASHTPYMDNLVSLRQPPSMSSNMPLPGLYEAASRIEYEDMAGIFSRAAAHLYEKTVKHPDLSFNSPSTCDPQAVRAPMPSSVPFFDTMEFSNSFNFLSASEYTVPSLVQPFVLSMREPKSEKGIQLSDPEADFYNLVSRSSSFSESMLHAMELFQGTSSSLPATSFPPTPSPLDQSSASEGISPSLHSPSIVHPDVSGMITNMTQPPNSPSKQDSSVLSVEDSDADRKIQSHISKRRNCGDFRKAQPKRVVCIPIGDGKQKGEAPPSDMWAWRKYGQKPIKGSPYPRGYYRCSSSKGCPARKQVERSHSDPTMLVVTYTSDHSHPWPPNRSSNSSKTANLAPSKDKNQDPEDKNRCENEENLFSSIINSPNAVDEQVVSMDSLNDEESFILQRDVDIFLSRKNTEGDDVFDDLGELPELYSIFSKGYVEEKLDEEGCEQPGFF